MKNDGANRHDGGAMTTKKKPEPDDKEQSARFVETAKALESDESGKGFERALEVVVPTKPPHPKNKRRR